MLKKSILCFVLLVCFSPLALAESLFTVEGVEVDVTAENAIAAREKAFEEAQIKAFETLAERMLSAQEAETYQVPDINTVSTLIKDYEVTQEKLSSVRYVGTYTIRFRENAVRRLFGGTGQTYTDVQSQPVLILPFYKKGAQTVLWAPNNLWIQAWSRNAKANSTLVPIVVPIGDLNDVADIGDHQSRTYNESNLRRMLKRYNAGEAVIVEAIAGPHMAMIENPNQPATGTLDINVYRTDRNGPEYVNSLAIAANPDKTLGEVMDGAVAQVKDLLKNDWKSRTSTNAAEATTLDVRVPIKTLSDWSEIQTALNGVAGIQNVTVQSLSPKQAVVQIQYLGNSQRLSLALDQADLVLSTDTDPMDPGFYQAGTSKQYILMRKYDMPARRGWRERLNTNNYAKTF